MGRRGGFQISLRMTPLILLAQTLSIYFLMKLVICILYTSLNLQFVLPYLITLLLLLLDT